MMIDNALTSDVDLLAMIQRHDAAWAEWDGIFAETGEDDPRIPALSDETTDLAKRIAVTPAHTVEGRDGKTRIIEREDLESWDSLGLIETVRGMDAARIAAAA